MTPPLSENEVERRLSEVGKNLLRPPSSVDELLPILDQTMELLSKVEQSPSQSMVAVLSPLMEELIAKALMKHSNVDVKVGVASCISEITRITAPEAPFGDDTMKDVFQLIVSSFENISDKSSRSHEKRATILETVAKIRSCVIMLDLECDEMIVDMFQYFLKEIRDDLAEGIFASMESIMTLVIEESEDISLDLLNPILSALKDNKDVPLIAKKLAEGVVRNCAEKLGPYLKQALTTLDASLEDYSNVVASICCVENGTENHTDKNIFKDQAVKKRAPSASPVTQVVKDEGERENHDDLPMKRSPESTMNNPVNESGTVIKEEAMADATDTETVIKEEAMADAVVSETPMEEAADDLKEADNNLSDVSKSESDDEGAKKSAESEADVEHTTNNDSVDSSNLHDDDKHTDEPAPESPSEEDVHSSPKEDALPVEEPKDDDLLIATPGLRGSLPKKSRSKKTGRRTSRKGILFRKGTTTADGLSKKASEQKTNSEAKKKQNTVKKQPVETADEEKAVSSDEDVSRNDGGNTSDTESRSLNQTEKPVDAIKKKNERTQSKNEVSKKGGTAKKTSGRDLGKDKVTSPKSPLSKSTKQEDVKEESSKMSTKRKRTPVTEKASESTKFGKNLVGSKVKVWWPADKTFYEGVVSTYDSAKNKHQIVYADGDTETLNLQREKWEFVEDDKVQDEVPAGDDDSCSEASLNLQTMKKAFEASNKRAKLESSTKGKSKGMMVTKSAGKSKEENKPDTKAKDKNTKSSGKTEEKSKERSQKVGAKSEEKTPTTQSSSQKSVTKGKGSKTPQSVKPTTPSTNGSGVKKTGSAKSPSDSIKLSDMAKKKPSDAGKSPASEEKSGKKRRR